MISIANSFVLKFKLEDLEDFIDVQDLKTFSLIEDTGIVLPTFKLIFETNQEKVMRYFNEGANLQVSMGTDNLNMDSINLSCISTVISKKGNDSFIFTLAGIFDALDFIQKPQLTISSTPESALEALSNRVSNYFTVDFDPATSEDSQIYIQPNITDKKFSQQLISRAKLSDSAPISGITSEGVFKVRDIKKLASEPYVWKFTKGVKDKEKDIFYEAGNSLESSSGLINSLAGYGRNIYELDFVEGTSAINNDTTTSVFSNSSTPSRKSSISERMGPMVPINDNIDSDYYKTGLRNSMYNLTCSEYIETVRFVNLYKKVSVLDLVMYIEPSVRDNATLEYTSGLYVITKVVRNISGGFFQTICELCRESLNNPEGDLR